MASRLTIKDPTDRSLLVVYEKHYIPEPPKCVYIVDETTSLLSFN